MAATNLIPSLFGAFAKRLSPTIAAAQYIGRDFEPDELKYHGNVITVPIEGQSNPDDVEAVTERFVPSVTDGAALADNEIQMTLSHYRRVLVNMGHKAHGDHIEGRLKAEGGRIGESLARYTNRAILREYKNIDNVIYKRKPWGDGTMGDQEDIDVAADEQLMPVLDRIYLLGTRAYRSAATNAELRRADATGKAVGDRLRTFDTPEARYVLDQDVELSGGPNADETVRKAGATFLASGAVSVGDEEITIDAITGVLEDGDVLFAGTASVDPDTSDDDDYIGVVQGTTAANGTTINIYGGAARAIVDNGRLAVVRGRQNLLITKGAIQIAHRVPGDPSKEMMTNMGMNAPGITVIETDPQTNLPVILKIWPGMDMMQIAFYTLFGVATPQPDRALRIVSID